MKLPRRQRVAACVALILTLWFAGAERVFSAEKLSWGTNRVSAEISTWNLSKLLQKLAEASGWEIYVEPDAKHITSTKFKDRPQGEALRLLLGDLSFALLPAETNQAARLFVFRTSLQEATLRVRFPHKSEGEDTGKPIPNELIVTLKPGVSIDEIAKKYGAKVTGRLDKLNTYRLQFEDAESTEVARKELEQDSDVTSVESNFPVSRPPAPDMLALSSFDPMNLTPKAPKEGCDVVVGLIDTAVQTQGTGLNGFLLPSIAVAGDSTTSQAQPTHGTAMFETLVRSGGSGVRILPVDVYGGNPSTSTFDVGMGIYKAVNAGAQIINLSLGSDGNSPFLQHMIQSSHDQGIIFFAAAGNEPVATPTYPAAYPEVVAVTAGNSRGVLAPYANYGDFVDVMAPGSAIVNLNGRSWLVMGTSASTAYASGVAASLLDGSCGTPRSQIETQVREKLAFKPQ